MQNHEIIGMSFDFDVPTWNERCIEQFEAVDYHVLNDAKEFAATSHLGLIDSKRIVGYVSVGAEWAARYKELPKPDPDARFMEDWLPLHANAIFLSGLKLGICDPEFPPEIAAYLMTPDSVGVP